MTKDESEGINSITWKANHKVEQITKADGSQIMFEYDALGNRIGKKFFPNVEDPTVMDATHYVLDAQGNPLSNYTFRIRPDAEELVRYDIRLKEQNIYGSSRLGMETRNDLLTAQTYADENPQAQVYDMDELEEGTYCQEAGTWLFDNPHSIGNFGGDASTDLRIEEDADLFFAGHFTANTQAGEQYTLTFDVVARRRKRSWVCLW